MKTVNDNFQAGITGKVQRPQFIIKIYMGLDKSDPVYFTSHKNTPVPIGSVVLRNSLRAVSGKSQKLNVLKANAEIGTLRFDIVDKKGAITDLFNSKFFDAVLEKAMRHREVELYVGYGFNNSDYELIFTQRIGGSLGYDGGKYSVNCFDIQREQRKKIFQPKQTRLTSSIKSDLSGVDISFSGNQISSATTDLSGFVAGEFILISGSTGNSSFFEISTSSVNSITVVEPVVAEPVGQAITISQATINVLDTSSLLSVDHGPSYTDGTAGSKVGYIKVNKEVFTWEDSGKSATRFDRVKRASLGARPAQHNVDPGVTSDDRLPKVTEVIHLEMPSLKIAYALLTGVLYGQAGETLPEHWHAGIPTNLVNAAEFVQYGDEGLWDSSDDTKGQILRFIEEKEIECKKYIEERLMRTAGCFMIVRATGALGLIKSTGVIHDAATVAVLDESNVRKVSSLRYDQNDVYNLFKLKWNFIDKKPTRESILFDNPSQDKYDKSLSMTIPLYGIYGGRHTKNTIANIFDTMRDRYAGSPLKASVDCHTSLGLLEVGDIVQLKIDHIPDHTSNGKTLNRAVEVQRISVDFTKGVTLDVFGSTERSKSILQYTDGASAGSAFITSQGQDILTYLESTYGVDVVTDKSIPGLLKIVGDCTLPGDPSMANAIYYYDGAMQIDAGVTVIVTHNWQWRFTDHFTNNGTIDGAGRGRPGGTVGGYLGVSRGQRSVVLNGAKPWYYLNPANPAEINQGTHSVAPHLNLAFDGSVVSGIPNDIRPVAGLNGGNLTVIPFVFTTGVWSGGAGGAGGSSGVIISDGATGGFSSAINLSGNVGASGDSHPDLNINAGNGGCGYGGCLYMIKLTPLSAIAGVSESLSTINGGITNLTPYKPVGHKFFGIFQQTTGDRYGPASSNATQQYNRASSNYIDQFMPTFQEPAEDLPADADTPLEITLTENQNTPQTTAANLATITVDVTPPNTDGYAYSNIYKRLQGATAWELEGPADNQWVIQSLAMTGLIYEVAAFPVSTDGSESTDFIMNTITMSVATGGVVLESGNYIQTSATVGGGVDGQGIRFSQSLIQAFDSVGTAKVTIDGTTGTITCIDANITGTINAGDGYIGGWSINVDSLSNASGTLSIDNANERIRVSNVSGNNHVDISPAGIIGVDSVLGTTFKLPTDGSAPEFSSGVIRESEYQIYTTGVIKTSADPASTGGVLINNTGVNLYDSSGNKTMSLDSSGNLNSGDSTDYLTGAGMFAGRSGGFNKFSVGDPATEQYLAFDGQNVELGRDTQLRGADAYNNASVYYNKRWMEADISRSATALSSITINYNNVSMFAGATVSERVSALFSGDYEASLVGFYWSKPRRFKLAISFTGSSNNGKTAFIQTGNIESGTNGVGFKVEEDGSVTAVVRDNGIEYTSTNLMSGAYTAGELRFEVIISDNTSYFYIDDVLEATIAQSPQTALQSEAQRMVSVVGKSTSAGIGGLIITISEFRFLQE